jgi:hypothetical protein
MIARFKTLRFPSPPVWHSRSGVLIAIEVMQAGTSFKLKRLECRSRRLAQCFDLKSRRRLKKRTGRKIKSKRLIQSTLL